MQGTQIQSFFPIISKEASQYDNQFQRWDTEFQPHEIGQIPLVGNHFPYNNVFYDTNSGAISDEHELNKEYQSSDNNVNTNFVNSNQEKSDNQPTLSVDDKSVSYEGWSVLTKEDKDRINVNSKNTFGNDDLHPILKTAQAMKDPPLIHMPKQHVANKYNNQDSGSMTHSSHHLPLPRKKSYKHYRQGQNVINESFNEVSQAPISYSSSPWKRNYNRNRFNGGFRKHRRRLNPYYGKSKGKRWQRKKKNHFRRRPNHHGRRHQPYAPHPLARQLNYNPVGVSLGVTSPVYRHHFENAPIYMNNAVKQTGGIFKRIKSGFNGIARGWRFTVDETARILKDAMDKTVRRVSHGYSKMGRKRNDRFREYSVGYRYPSKEDAVAPSMDYAIDFHPIANPYPPEYMMNDDDGSNHMTSSKYDYDLYGNFIESNEYLDYGKERNVASYAKTKHLTSGSNDEHKRPMPHTTTPHSVLSNMETPLNSHMFDQTPFLQSSPDFGSQNSSPMKPPRQPSSSSTSTSKENKESMENVNKNEIEYKKRQKLKDIWRKNPRKKRQPIKMNITKIVTTKRPRKTAFGYLRNTARPGKREKKMTNNINKGKGATRREEDLKEVTQAWYSYYRKLKNYRQKYRRNSDTSLSESMAAAKRFSRHKKMPRPSKEQMMLKHKMDMKRMAPPTTLKSTAVLQSPYEHLNSNWQVSSRTHPTIPNSIRDIIHGNQNYNPPKLVKTVQMMTKEMKNENLQAETPQMPGQEHNLHLKEEIMPGNGQAHDGYELSPTQHWVDTSNTINDAFSRHQKINKDATTNDVEYEYIDEDDDPRSIVYGEILTPDWQNAFVHPSSNLQQAASSNEISAQAIAKELSAIEARIIASQEISNEVEDRKDMMLEDEPVPEMNDKSGEHSP